MRGVEIEGNEGGVVSPRPVVEINGEEAWRRAFKSREEWLPSGIK